MEELVKEEIESKDNKKMKKEDLVVRKILEDVGNAGEGIKGKKEETGVEFKWKKKEELVGENIKTKRKMEELVEDEIKGRKDEETNWR